MNSTSTLLLMLGLFSLVAPRCSACNILFSCCSVCSLLEGFASLTCVHTDFLTREIMDYSCSSTRRPVNHNAACWAPPATPDARPDLTLPCGFSSEMMEGCLHASVVKRSGALGYCLQNSLEQGSVGWSVSLTLAPRCTPNATPQPKPPGGL